MKKNILLIVLFCLVCSAQISAQEKIRGSRTLPFLEISADPRSAAMGDAQGEANGMYIYANPTSVLYKEQKLHFSYVYGSLLNLGNSRLAYQAASIALKNENQVFLLGFRYLGGVKEDRIDLSAVSSNKLLQPNDLSLDLAYSRKITDKLSAFLSANMIKSYINTSSYTSGLSGGAQYRNAINSSIVGGSYLIGASFHDIGTQIKYSKKKYHLPSSFAVQSSVELFFKEKHKITVALSPRYYFLPSNARTLMIGFGCEYEMFNTLALRAGYRLIGSVGIPSFGLGINLRYVSLDASYSIGNSKLSNNVLKIGLSTKF